MSQKQRIKVADYKSASDWIFSMKIGYDIHIGHKFFHQNFQDLNFKNIRVIDKKCFSGAMPSQTDDNYTVNKLYTVYTVRQVRDTPHSIRSR